jgi:hypothetical protein
MAFNDDVIEESPKVLLLRRDGKINDEVQSLLDRIETYMHKNGLYDAYKDMTGLGKCEEVARCWTVLYDSELLFTRHYPTRVLYVRFKSSEDKTAFILRWL